MAQWWGGVSPQDSCEIPGGQVLTLKSALSRQDQLQEMSMFSSRVLFLWRKIFQI